MLVNNRAVMVRNAIQKQKTIKVIILIYWIFKIKGEQMDLFRDFD